MTLEPDLLTRRMAGQPRVAADLAQVGIHTGADLLKYLVLDGEMVDALTDGAPTITDDRATVEFAELHRLGVAETFPQNLAMLGSAMDPQHLARRTRLEVGWFWARERLMRAQLRIRERSLESVYAAVVDLEQARQFSPDDADLREPLEALRGTRGRSIANDYQRLLESPALHDYLGMFQYARLLRPEDAFFAQLLGAAHLRLGEFERAVEPLETAVALRPTDITFLSNLAFAYERTNQIDAALALLDRIETLPGSPDLSAVHERLQSKKETP